MFESLYLSVFSSKLINVPQITKEHLNEQVIEAKK